MHFIYIYFDFVVVALLQGGEGNDHLSQGDEHTWQEWSFTTVPSRMVLSCRPVSAPSSVKAESSKLCYS